MTLSCADAASLADGGSLLNNRSNLQRDLLEIGLLWRLWGLTGGTGGISCTDAQALNDEAAKTNNRSGELRDVLQISLLWEAYNNLPSPSMAALTCADIETLINEASATANRTPSDRETIKLALLARIAGAGAITPTGIQIYVGTGSPEGVVTASYGIYIDITNPSAPQTYIKTTPSGNTGWVG